MHTIVMPKEEVYFEDINEIFYFEETEFVFEHSLISISKWEETHHKAFFGNQEKSIEDMMDYIECMVVSPEKFDKMQLKRLTHNQKLFAGLVAYINDPHTATTFRSGQEQKRLNETPTSELIYYWMICNQIPHEYESWHINRLLTLIRVCSLKNNPPKKRSAREIMTDNRALNEARKAKLGTKG